MLKGDGNGSQLVTSWVSELFTSSPEYLQSPAFESCHSPHLQQGWGWSWARSPSTTRPGPLPEQIDVLKLITYLNHSIAKYCLQYLGREERQGSQDNDEGSCNQEK